MDTTTMIWSFIGLILAAFAILSIRGWITVYNKFVYWKNKLDGRFADIDIIMQRRIDMIPALAQVAKKYSIHEDKVFKDIAEARSRWSKDKSLNDKVKTADQIENNFIKIQTVFERYPKIKADKLYQQIMGSGNITRVDKKLEAFRLKYNRTVRDYNERVQMFPRSIVAKVYGFKPANYLSLGNQINLDPHEAYKPKELFKD